MDPFGDNLEGGRFVRLIKLDESKLGAFIILFRSRLLRITMAVLLLLLFGGLSFSTRNHKTQGSIRGQWINEVDYPVNPF